MERSKKKTSVIAAIAVIAGAIVIAAGVLLVFKKLCDKYRIVEKKSKRYVDYDEADEDFIPDGACGAKEDSEEIPEEFIETPECE